MSDLLKAILFCAWFVASVAGIGGFLAMCSDLDANSTTWFRGFVVGGTFGSFASIFSWAVVIDSYEKPSESEPDEEE